LDGPFAGTNSTSFSSYLYLVLSEIKLIQQGGQWIPASYTNTYVRIDGTGVVDGNGVITATLASSGMITITSTITSTGSDIIVSGPQSETSTIVEIVNLGTGSSTPWTRQEVDNVTFTDQDGCAGVETVTHSSTGIAPVALQPYMPQASVALADPTNFGGQILPLPSSVDPNSVPNAPGVGGISADGASAAAIVYQSFSSQPVIFTLTGTSSYSGDVPGGSIGGLTSFDPNYPSNPQTGSLTPIQVSTPLDATTCNLSTDQAGTSNCTFLALLWAPATMPYSDADLLALTPEPTTLTVTATQNDVNGVQGTVSSEALLQPPPLVLVHGVWDTAATWDTFRTSLQTSGYPNSGTYPADYGNLNNLFNQNSPTNLNALTFEEAGTQRILAQTIADALTGAASQGIVARKVDVVAHSMGGLVTLYFLNQGFTPAPVVTLPNNPVHKLVTIGTPYVGSPLASELWRIKDQPPITLLGLIPNPVFQVLCSNWALALDKCTPTVIFGKFGHPIVSGVPGVPSAIQSLQSGLGSLSSPFPHSAIVGETTGSPRATELALDAIIGIYAPGVTDSSLFGGLPNDTIVSASGQAAPNSSDFVTVTGVEHVSLCQVASWIPGCTNFDFSGETQSSAVFSQALSSLMGNVLSGTVAQTQDAKSRGRLGEKTSVAHSLRAAAH